ncbi:TPA: hypothetical protein HA318_00870 [Candidatus Micrarchaeota archaeon]|nr:MAG: hypothetical protein AUJ65_04680 [Candidatus Micrarchaeota archaeon CG1_02_51_15]HII38540.1 hypothetical protein [Candidatus Micrarchaeota archaeon]
MKTYFIQLAHSSEDALKLLKKTRAPPFVITRTELGFFPRFLKYSLFSTYKSFQNDEPTAARTLGLAWLCKIACTKNIDRTLELTKPNGGKAAITSEDELPPESIALTGTVYEPTATERKAAEKTLQKLFEITDAALEEYALEDLLIEKAAVAATF